MPKRGSRTKRYLGRYLVTLNEAQNAASIVIGILSLAATLLAWWRFGPGAGAATFFACAFAISVRTGIKAEGQVLDLEDQIEREKSSKGGTSPRPFDVSIDSVPKGRKVDATGLVGRNWGDGGTLVQATVLNRAEAADFVARSSWSLNGQIVPGVPPGLVPWTDGEPGDKAPRRIRKSEHASLDLAFAKDPGHGDNRADLIQYLVEASDGNRDRVWVSAPALSVHEGHIIRLQVWHEDHEDPVVAFFRVTIGRKPEPDVSNIDWRYFPILERVEI